MILRIATWNVLASAYCVPTRYPQCAPGWDDPQRRPREVARIVSRLADKVDAVCLQEVDDTLIAAIGEALPGVAMSSAGHQGRRDAVMVLTRGAGVPVAPQRAGRMAAAGLVIERASRRISVLSTHLEWSADGATGRSQLEALLGWMGAAQQDHRILGMDANAAGGSVVCASLRERGWSVSPAVDSALVHGRGWVPLDVVAVDRGEIAVRRLEAAAPGATTPSGEWPSDHLALITEVTLS
jgi:endonuclease/exonuclease/phosphatase family metal-dependent hydrolase